MADLARRCAEAHAAAAEARTKIAGARSEIQSLRQAQASGAKLSDSQLATQQAVNAKFGSSSDKTLAGVDRTLGRISDKIGAEGSGLKVSFGVSNPNFQAQAPEGGNSILIGKAFFGPNSLGSSAIIHEGGHSAGLVDVRLPSGAPPGIGWFAPGFGLLAQGRSATDFLGGYPSLAQTNSDSYACTVDNVACGGP